MKGNTKSVHGLIFLVAAALLWMGCPNPSIETLDNNLPNENEEEDSIETPDSNLPDENEEEDSIETPDNNLPDESEEENSVQEIAGTVVNYSARNITFSMITVPGGIVFPTGVDDSGRETVENAFMIGETEVTYSLWNTVRTWAQNRGYRISSGRAGSLQTAGGPGPFAATSDREPVTSIAWYDAAVWCNALTEWVNAQTGTSLNPVYYYRQGGSLCKNSVNLETFVREDEAHQFGSVFADSAADGFRLPAAKEWEVAARWQESEAINAVNGLSDPYFCKGDSASGAAAA
ncbi:MAG: formylglycine-generating enzyme family protein, partial [Treponema sp.]|nr:formylglycine-generating enzyme family protein [Treponema sp.]